MNMIKNVINKNDNKNDEIQTKIENNKYTLDLINIWINNADTKISISCGLSSLVVALMVFLFENFYGKYSTIIQYDVCILNVAKIFAFTGAILFITSLWFHFWALNPNLMSLKEAEGEKNSLFFADIARFKDADEYMNHIDDISKLQYNKELVEEIYENSKICTNKMKRFKTGMRLSILAIAIIIFAVVIYSKSILPME